MMPGAGRLVKCDLWMTADARPLYSGGGSITPTRAFRTSKKIHFLKLLLPHDSRGSLGGILQYPAR